MMKSTVNKHIPERKLIAVVGHEDMGIFLRDNSGNVVFLTSSLEIQPTNHLSLQEVSDNRPLRKAIYKDDKLTLEFDL